jgi:ABC-type uncharacterized transport system substrate-binding protein
MIILKDTCHASDRETEAVVRWMMDALLKGAKPAILPFEQPSKFELVVNMKTAAALGITVPPALVLRADRTIH